MAPDLQKIVNSPYTVRFVSRLARTVPLTVGYPACDLIGKWAAAQHNSNLTRAVRLNQWVVRGASLETGGLNAAVQETLQNNVRDLYELYHHLDCIESIRNRVHLSPLAENLVRRPEFEGRGLVVVGVHLSGFDLVMLSLIRQGGKALVLTIPNPQGGRRVEYEMRRRTGMNIVPASLDALRQAVSHLEDGGLVLTGIDRPVPNPRLHPHFFGHPTNLPTHHIFLAMKARVPLVLMSAIRQRDGTYNVLSSDPMEMEQHADHEMGTLRNAEMILQYAEDFIRRAPQQWNVPLPVWPDLSNKVPY